MNEIANKFLSLDFLIFTLVLGTIQGVVVNLITPYFQRRARDELSNEPSERPSAPEKKQSPSPLQLAGMTILENATLLASLYVLPYAAINNPLLLVPGVVLLTAHFYSRTIVRGGYSVPVGTALDVLILSLGAYQVYRWFITSPWWFRDWDLYIGLSILVPYLGLRLLMPIVRRRLAQRH